MKNELNCNQVSALINFYLENKLNPKLKKYIDKHIEKCPNCKKKINELKNILAKYKIKTTQSEKCEEFEQQLPQNFVYSLSAYIDNELNTNENIKIKKITISNPTARKELETMYKFKRLLHNAYEKTKNDSKYDYSKNIVSKIQNNYEYTTNYFYKLAVLFVLLISAIVGGFIYLYF